MAITIQIYKQITTPAQGGPNPSDGYITAHFAIRDDAVAPTWYRWQRGGIPLSTIDVQAFLEAEGTSLYTSAAANGDVVTDTDIEIFKLYRASAYYDAIMVRARKNLTESLTLVQSLNELVDKLNDDTPEFNNFTTYKNGRGLAGTVTPADITAMTVANRQLLLAIIVEWVALNLAGVSRISDLGLFA